MAYGATTDNASTKPEFGATSPDMKSGGLGVESSPEKKMADMIMSETDKTLETEKLSLISQLKTLQLVSDEVIHNMESGDMGAFVEIADRYEPLCELVRVSGITGAEYADCVKCMKEGQELPGNIERLLTGAREVRELEYEGLITRPESKVMLGGFCRAQKGSPEDLALDPVEAYSANIIQEAEGFVVEGVLTDEEMQTLRENIIRSDITIMGTPRVNTPEAEMAWSMLAPVVDKIKKWRGVGELKKAGFVSEGDCMVTAAAIKQNEMIPPRIANLLDGLGRLHYARFKEVIEHGSEYDNALKSIPYLVGVEPQGNDISDVEEEIAMASRPDLTGEAYDFPNEQKKFLLASISAWEAMLGWQLMKEFENILNSANSQEMSRMSEGLIKLSREYNQDKVTEVETKKLTYLTKIRELLG